LLQRFFREEGFDKSDALVERHVRQMLGYDFCAVLVVEEGGVAVGVATVSMDFGIEYGWSAEMGDLFVLPEWRGRGISRALIAAVEDYLRAKGAFGYQVSVTPEGESTQKIGEFYRAPGFEDDGRRLLYRAF
jgi:GNAT superfamily N-acetyltransferase